MEEEVEAPENEQFTEAFKRIMRLPMARWKTIRKESGLGFPDFISDPMNTLMHEEFLPVVVTMLRQNDGETDFTITDARKTDYVDLLGYLGIDFESALGQ